MTVFNRCSEFILCRAGFLFPDLAMGTPPDPFPSVCQIACIYVVSFIHLTTMCHWLVALVPGTIHSLRDPSLVGLEQGTFRTLTLTVAGTSPPLDFLEAAHCLHDLDVALPPAMPESGQNLCYPP